VLQVTHGAHSILLAGDVEAIQEDELAGRYPEKLQASVLVVPHHGSGSSSSLPFLQTVRPQGAVFLVGYRNRFHHPKAEVYERYRGLGIERLRSDEDGAVTIRFGNAVEVAAYRREHRRYWYGR
jgi:competence protein ComEC